MKASLGELPRYRYRLRFTKTGRLQFLGHLDLTRTMFRAFRRSRIVLVYSQGFNPKPRVQFGPALVGGDRVPRRIPRPVDVHALDAGRAMTAINASLPAGLEVSGSPRSRATRRGSRSRSARPAISSDSLPELDALPGARGFCRSRWAGGARARRTASSSASRSATGWSTSLRPMRALVPHDVGAGGEGASVPSRRGALGHVRRSGERDPPGARGPGDALRRPPRGAAWTQSRSWCRLTSELLVSRAGGRTCTALREDGVTVELRVEHEAAELTVGHIVKARVSKVLPGIQSAFLDLGSGPGRVPPRRRSPASG